MARHYLIPDPQDRSVNSPSIIVNSQKVLSYYNAKNKSDQKERVVDSVKNWYIKEAKKEGWHYATFHGSDCLLEVDVKIDDKN